MRWVFFMFQRVRTLSLRNYGKTVTRVVNLGEMVRIILNLLGAEC